MNTVVAPATSSPGPDARTESVWPWRGIAAAGALFVTAIAALSAIEAARSHLQAIDDAGRALQMQSRVLAEQAARSLQSVDTVLRNVAEDARSGQVAALRGEALHAYLESQARGLVQVESVAVFDARGDLVASSLQAAVPSPPASFEADPMFQSLRDTRPRRDAPASVGAAREGRVLSRTWFLPVARRLERGDGQFAGAVAASMRVDYFQNFYRDIRPEAGTTIALLHREGNLVARFPPAEDRLGHPVPDTSELATDGSEPRDVLRSESPIDGVERLGVRAAVPGWPLVVVVTRDADAVLAPWRDATIGSAWRTAALVVVAVALLWLLRGQLRRQQRLRQSLEVSRERFALAAAGSEEGIWDWTVRGDTIYVSPRAREIFGVPAGPEVLPRGNWLERVEIHPDDLPRRVRDLEAHLSGREPVYAGEYRVRHPDGAWHWIRVRGLCVRDAQGQPTRMAGSVTDIDAHRRAEDALRLSQERYALAMAGLTGGHWVWDVPTDALFVSDSLNRLYGLDEDRPVTTRDAYFKDVRVHPDDRLALARINDDVLGGRATRLEFEHRVLLPDAAGVRWVLTRAQCFAGDDGRPRRVAGVSVDITQRKQTEEALRASEERFTLAVAGADDGIWDFDYVSQRVFGSRRAREILGMRLEPEVQSFDQWFAEVPMHPDDAPRRLQAMNDHLDGRTPAYEGEWRVRSADGGWRWVRVRGVCVRDPAGRPLRMAGSVSDIDARKRAEESLRRSEERYALAVAGSDDGVWDWDLVNGVAFESQRARELQGLEPGAESQPLGDLLHSLRVHPDDAARREQGIRDHLAGLTAAYECEYRVLDRTGRYRWIRVRAMCVRDDAGRPTRMAGSVTDIDARMQAVEASRHSEERFALAVAGSKDGILDWDVVHDRMYVSSRALEIVGLAPDTPIATQAQWAAALMPRLCSDDAQRLAQALKSQPGDHPALHEGEYRVCDDDRGGWRWVRFRGMSVRDDQGRLVRWAGSLSDIDSQKKTEDALRRSDERYQLAVAGSDQGLWDWDLRSDEVFLSPRAQQLLWVEPGEAQRPRREWIALTPYHPDDVAMVRETLAGYLEGRSRSFKVEYRVRHHSGEWHWYRQRGIAVRDDQGRPTRMAGSVEDITDRKNADAERDRLELQLRQAQKLEAIGTLAGGIAHDFNNILAAILGYGEMALRDAPEGSAQRRYIDAAVSAGLRAKSLVERILAFGRSGIGERVPVHVQSAVAEALDQLTGTLPAGITIEQRLEAGHAAVLGDPTQVHQVVMNLCANAVQAMKSSGTLEVTLERAEGVEPTGITGTLPRGSYVRLRVRDTGSGIAPEILERIFDPFFTTKEVGVGTGLGLSLVHGIVTDLGGGIEVVSEPGCGSTFTVHLPWQSCVAPPSLHADTPPAPGRGQTVLLVDDEEALVRLGEEVIAELGYEPVGFTSSRSALQAFSADPSRYDAVLSDESMPGMTGSELARAIRAIRADIPIVLMTGHVTPALHQRARDCGVAEVLAKPLVARDIARCLADALPATRGAEPVAPLQS